MEQSTEAVDMTRLRTLWPTHGDGSLNRGFILGCPQGSTTA